MRNSLWHRLGAAVVLASLALVSITPSVRAQMPSGMSAQQANPLGLTPAQQTKILNLRTKAQAKAQAIQTSKTLTRPQQMSQLKALDAQYQKDSMAVLTPSQRSTVLAKQNEFKAKIAQLKALTAKLQASMTPKQNADLKALKNAQTAQVQALISNKTLTDDQKRSQFQAIQVGNEAKFNAIFTPAQMAMLTQVTSIQAQLRAMTGQQ